MAVDKRIDLMGGNARRDGDAVRKIAKELNIDPARLKAAVEDETKYGRNNLTYDEIYQIALAIKSRKR